MVYFLKSKHELGLFLWGVDINTRELFFKTAEMSLAVLITSIPRNSDFSYTCHDAMSNTHINRLSGKNRTPYNFISPVKVLRKKERTLCHPPERDLVGTSSGDESR